MLIVMSALSAVLLLSDGCAVKKPTESPSPGAASAPVRMSFPPEVQAFLDEMKGVQSSFTPKIAGPYQEGFQINQQFINPRVPLQQRKLHAQELVKLMKTVSTNIPDMQKQVEAIKAPASLTVAKQHFNAHLAAMKREADEFVVYADLACSKDNPGKEKGFQASISRLNIASGERQYEIAQYQMAIKSLALPSPTPAP